MTVLRQHGFRLLRTGETTSCLGSSVGGVALPLAAGVFFKTAYRAFLPALLAPGRLLEGNAKLQGSEQVANVTGPGVAVSSCVLLLGPLPRMRDLPGG